MSCNQFAEGTIILPKKDYIKTVKHFHDSFFTIVLNELPAYNNFAQSLIEKYKGKRNLDWSHIWEHFLCEKSEFKDSYGYNSRTDNLSRIPNIYNIFYSQFREKPKKLTERDVNKIMKKFLTEAKSSDVNVSAFISYEEATVSFNKTSHSVNIHVSQNNRSVDRFQDSSLFKTLNSILKTVQWTRNTGGTILMNDEYHIEEMGGGYPFVQYNVQNKI